MGEVVCKKFGPSNDGPIIERHLAFDLCGAAGIVYCRCVWCLTVPWLRRLVAGLSAHKPVFDPRSIHVGFIVDKVIVGQVLLWLV